MLVVVGRIGRPHGLRGEVTVEVLTDDPDARFAPGATLLTEPAATGPLTVESSRRSGRLTIVRFHGVADRDAAQALRGTVLQVSVEKLPELLDDDDFYDHQLIGLRVVDVAGSDLGSVTSILHAPAAPVLVVARPDGTEEMVPFVKAIVPQVDLERGSLTVDPPDGMFA